MPRLVEVRRPQVEIDETKLVARGAIPAGDASRDDRAVAAQGPNLSAAGAPGTAQTTAEAVIQEGVADDPPEPRGWKVSLFVYASAGLLGLLLNFVGTGVFKPVQLLGTLMLVLLTALAFRLAKWVPSVPASVWVLGIATIISAPFMPFADIFVGLVDGMSVMLFGLLQLALIGLSLGRDIGAIKQLSWRVVVVALLTLSSTFIVAAALAESVLHL